MSDGETIAAIATAMGASAVGIVRISGPDAHAVLRAVVPAFPAAAKNARLYRGSALHPRTQVLIDDVLSFKMVAPHSYTGEDTAEIQGHGGLANMRLLLEAVVSAGARLAEPGEFSRRAFVNGKIDLSRAEAIERLIVASSEQAQRIAIGQLSGGLETRIRAVRERLVGLLAEIEGAIDFPDEGLDAAVARSVLSEIEAIYRDIGNWAASYRNYALAQEGFEVALIGAPNAGKSSLLNALLGSERAVTSPIAGTTRDFVDAKVRYRDLAMTFVDTPGIHNTDSAIDRAAIEMAMDRAKRATARVWVHDSTIADPVETGSSQTIDFLALNKVDLLSASDAAAVRDRFATHFALSKERVFLVSAHTKLGIAELKSGVFDAVSGSEAHSAEGVVTTERQARLLRLIGESLERASERAKSGIDELCAADLREALSRAAEIVGEGVDESVIDAIFQRFCIGK